jgi:hypothetical protein
MPGDFGDLAVNTRVHFYHHHAHTRLRVRLAPGIPHALWFKGRRILAQLGRFASRECEGVFGVGRHCEERSDEAIQLSLLRDGLLRFARNDGG